MISLFVRWSNGAFAKVPTGYNTPQPPAYHAITFLIQLLAKLFTDVQHATRQRLHHAIPWVDTAVTIV